MHVDNTMLTGERRLEKGRKMLNDVHMMKECVDIMWNRRGISAGYVACICCKSQSWNTNTAIHALATVDMYPHVSWFVVLCSSRLLGRSVICIV